MISIDGNSVKHDLMVHFSSAVRKSTLFTCLFKENTVSFSLFFPGRLTHITSFLTANRETEKKIMIHVIASVSIKQGRRPEFLDIFKANVPNVLQEKGCLEYRPTVDIAAGLDPQVLDENLVTIIEKWESLDDLRAHLTAPHMLDYRTKVSSMVEKVVLKVLEDA